MVAMLKELSVVLVTLTIATVLVIFRGEVRKLVNWLVAFKKIEKTKEGYSLMGSIEPERPRPDQPTVEEAVGATAIPSETDRSPAASGDVQDWLLPLISKDYSSAIAALGAQIQHESESNERVKLEAIRAHVYFEKNRAEGAVKFEQLLVEYPTREHPYTWYARSYLWADLPEKAIAIAKRGLDDVDQKGALYDVISDAFSALGRDDDAIAAAQKGVEAEPSYIENYLNIAQTLTRKLDAQSARNWYLRAVFESDGAESVLSAYAGFLSNHGFPGEAIFRYRTLVAAFPENPTYRTLLGNAYLSADLPSLAMEEYIDASTRAEGKEAWIVANIGNLYGNQGLVGRAIHHLRRALELNPQSTYAHERLAGALKGVEAEQKKLEALLLDVRRELGSLTQEPIGVSTPDAERNLPGRGQN